MLGHPLYPVHDLLRQALAYVLDPHQPTWSHKLSEDGKLVWQNSNCLSGAVAHTVSDGQVSFFGEMPAACELLDGLFLAVNAEKVLKANITFDPQFQFHFYDLDFCRVCRQKGLSLGTWPVAVTHGSSGGYGTPKWQDAKVIYDKKWG